MTNDLDNDAKCSPETIASYFRMISHYEEEIKETNEKIQQLMSMLQLEAGKTFKYEGQIYQVCKRKKEGTMFFKQLDAPPKSWLGKKAREERVRCRSNSVAPTTEEAVQVDVHEVSGDFEISDYSPNVTEALDEGASLGAVIID